VGSRISLDKIGPPKGTLQQALDCLKGFNANCAEQRKTVFADDQLSETDLVWMASHPHSGLSDSSLFGLSEAEIRQRLAIPTAKTAKDLRQRTASHLSLWRSDGYFNRRHVQIGAIKRIAVAKLT